MTVLIDLFKILRESGLLTAAFIIGAFALILAIIGNVKTIIELSAGKSVTLGAVGIAFIVLSIGGYFISLQPTGTVQQVAQQPTPTSVPPTTALNQPTMTPTLLPTFTRAVSPTTTPILVPTTAASVAIVVPICGEQAFRTEFLSDGRANVEINLPAGYVYAFVSSDPALVEFSNGTSRLFNTQFVLIAKDFSRITIKGVGTRLENGTRIVNSWACAYGNDGGQVAEHTARGDYNTKTTHNNIAELYRVDPQGFTLLASNLNK